METDDSSEPGFPAEDPFRPPETSGERLVEQPPLALRVLSFVVLAAGAWTVVTMVTTSLNPEQYFYYAHQDRSEWKWPGVSVGLIVLATIVEALVASWVFRPRGRWRSWPRALIALAVLVPWALVQLAAVMHAPAYHTVHLLWLFFVVLVLAAMLTTSAIAHVMTRVSR